MCGRYALTISPEFTERFSIVTGDVKAGDYYDVTPGSFMPIVTKNSPNKESLMKWGLVPHWAKDPKTGYKMINARAETVAEKPSFRHALEQRRCLIPASGFYEWKKLEDGKQRYFIKLKSQDIFGFAGLYETWLDAEKHPLLTFTIITTSANELMASIHDRMPVIIPRKHEAAWLDQTTEISIARGFLKPYPAHDMQASPVKMAIDEKTWRDMRASNKNLPQ